MALWTFGAGGCAGDGAGRDGSDAAQSPQGPQSLSDPAAPGASRLELQVAPSVVSLFSGQRLQLAAHTVDAAGLTEDVTYAVSWSVGDAAIATMSDSTLVAVAPGTTALFATLAGASATADVRVTSVWSDSNQRLDPNMSWLSGTHPPSLVLAPGARARFALLLDPDGTGLVDTARSATWASDAPLVAQVSSDGDITAVSEGSAILVADTGGGADTCAQVLVTHGALSSLSVDPTPPSVAVGTQLALSATGRFTGGAAGSPPADDSNWWVGDAALASVDAIGVLTAHRAGTTGVAVSASGVTSPTVALVVTPVSQVIASSATSRTILVSPWGYWLTYGYGAHNDYHGTVRFDTGAAAHLDFVIDSGGGGQTLNAGGFRHDLLVEQIDRISFSAWVTGGLRVYLSLENAYISADNGYRSYGCELVGISSTPASYMFTLAELPWMGSAPEQNYSVQDALRAFIGWNWAVYGAGGESGTLSIDNLTVYIDHR